MRTIRHTRLITACACLLTLARADDTVRFDVPDHIKDRPGGHVPPPTVTPFTHTIPADDRAYDIEATIRSPNDTSMGVRSPDPEGLGLYWTGTLFYPRTRQETFTGFAMPGYEQDKQTRLEMPPDRYPEAGAMRPAYRWWTQFYGSPFGQGGSPGSWSFYAELDMIALILRVDSNNDGEIDEEDEWIKNDEDKPGKVFLCNTGMTENAKPGFADFEAAAADFAEMEVEVVGAIGTIDWETALIRFEYNASDPAEVQEQTETINGVDVTTYTPAPGMMRIWTKPGDQTRSPASVADGGDYIPPEEELEAKLLFDGATLITLYIEGIDVGDVEDNDRGVVKAEFQPQTFKGWEGTYTGSQDWLPDQVRVRPIDLDILPVLIGLNGMPRIENGRPVLGSPLGPTEAVSVYVPSDGNTRGSPSYSASSHSDDHLVFVTRPCDAPECEQECCEASGTLNLNSPTLTGSWGHLWDMNRDATIEETRTFIWVETVAHGEGEVTNSVIANLTHDPLPESTLYGLTITIDFPPLEPDPNYEPLTREYAVYHIPQNYYSNVQISGPREDLGAPEWGDRTAFAIGVRGLTEQEGTDAGLRIDIECGDFGPENVPISYAEDHRLLTIWLVPVLPGDESSLGYLSSQPVFVPLNPRPPGTYSSALITIRITDDLIGSAQEIAQRRIPLHEAWLVTATLENSPFFRPSVFVPKMLQSAEDVRKKLGGQVTVAFSQTRDQLLTHLPRHRIWIHSGHGLLRKGIDIIAPTAQIGLYQKSHFSGSDATNVLESSQRYNLVFMNTCQSTNMFYDTQKGPVDFVNGIAQPVSLSRVMDIGMSSNALNARNYIGWDTNVPAMVGMEVLEILIEELRLRTTVAEAVAHTVEAVRVMTQDGPYRGIHRFLRLVRQDDDVVVNLKQGTRLEE